jgi:thiol-disulfide isomerase/thioredoxin
MKFWVCYVQRAFLFLAAFSLFILPACNNSAANGKSGKTASSSQTTTASTSDPTAVPTEMADAELTSVNGQTFKISDYKGKVVLINLWTTWCGFCKKQMPDLIALNQEFKDRDVEFLGLNAENEKLPAVEEYVSKYGIPYRVGWTNDEVFSVLSPNGFPSTYIITRDGRFHWAINGAASQERIRTKIEEALSLEG